MPWRNITFFSCIIFLLALGGVVGLSSTSSDAINTDLMVLAQARQATGGADESDMHSQEGLALFAAGKYEEAIRHYNEAIRTNPDNARAYNNRGVAYAKLGNYDQAISDYTKALQLNRGFTEAYYNRAVAAFHDRSYSQACSDLQQFRQFGGTPSPEFVKDLKSASGIGRC